MIGTLHRYVFREVFKAFVLTAVGLTLMFAMGGGLLNLVRIEQQVTVSQVGRLLWWFIPLVASFMLPIAALLSSALTYGRLSADNELDACKASGVNILRLLAASLVLAVGVGVESFYLSNFTVPRLIQRIDQLAQRDVEDIIVGELKDRGYLQFRKRYGLYAEDARKLTPREVSEVLGGDSADKDVIYVRSVAFVEFGGEEPARTGTAASALLIFDRASNPATLRARLQRVQLYDHNRMQFVALDETAIEPRQLPSFTPRNKLKFLDLFELFRYRERPLGTPAIQEDIRAFRQGLARLAFAEWFLESLKKPPHEVALEADWGRYRIILKPTSAYSWDDEHLMIHLKDVTVTEESAQGHVRYLHGDKAEVSADAGFEQVVVRLQLSDNVTLQDPQEGPRVVRQQSPYDLRAVPIPLAELGDVPPLRIARITDEQIVSPEMDTRLPPDLRKYRRGLADKLTEAQRQITAVIHARLTLALSTVVLVLLAAALGIVIRGGHALTAFGVAFVPTVMVVLLITMGRQLAESAATAGLGLGIMWGVLAAMTALDAAVMLRFIRR